ncbi:hypothetical protein [Actinocrispum sp. NPDC049592]|uniref:hypothetical protein n=1 Tax=Actinocrispum sp. NPDC049592 TaxID=3154835 RepID=UPI0034461BF2
MVVTLVVFAVAAWLVWGDRFPAASTSDVRADGDSGRRPGSAMMIADFGGGQDDYGYLRTFDDVDKLGFLSPEETQLFRAARPGPARILVNPTLPEGRLIVVVTQVRDRETARSAAAALNDLEIAGGFTRQAPLVLTHPSAARIHYHHNDLLVRMELTGPPDGFQPLLDRQLAVLSADD